MSNSNLNINTYHIPANSGLTIATGLCSSLAIDKIYESFIPELNYILFFNGENRGSGTLTEGFKINTSNLEGEGFTEVRLINPDKYYPAKVKIVFGSADYTNYKPSITTKIDDELLAIENTMSNFREENDDNLISISSILSTTKTVLSSIYVRQNTVRSSLFGRLQAIINKLIDAEDLHTLILAKNNEILEHLRNPFTLLSRVTYAGNATHQIQIHSETTHIKIYNGTSNKNFWLTLRANNVNGRLLSRRNISNQDSYRGDREIFLLDIQNDGLVTVSFQTAGTGTAIYFEQLRNNA